MTRRRVVAFMAALLTAGASSAAAEAVLQSIGWQAARFGRPRNARFSDAAEVSPPPPGAILILRGKATVKNRGPRPAEGLLLRYAVTARLTRGGEPDVASVWAVPLLVDERRVAQIPPNKVIEVPLSASPTIERYFKRMARRGLRVDRLRLQVMIEPRDRTDAVQTSESTLELRP